MSAKEKVRREIEGGGKNGNGRKQKKENKWLVLPKERSARGGWQKISKREILKERYQIVFTVSGRQCHSRFSQSVAGGSVKGEKGGAREGKNL